MPWEDGDTIRCRVNSSMFGAGIVLNIFTASLDIIAGPPPDDDDMADTWTAYLNDVLADLLDHVSSLFETHSFDLYRRDELGEWAWQHNEAYSPVYIGTAAVLPAGVAAVMTAFTAVNRVVGRKFFGGISEASLLEGLWGAGLVADLASAAAAYVTPKSLFPDFWRIVPGVYSTKVSGFIPFNLTALVTNIPGYQRRRKTGVGQ